MGHPKADQIIARGSFENGRLDPAALRIESEETLVVLNAQVGETRQSGQLRVRNSSDLVKILSSCQLISQVS